jgi:hypothetical protein
LFDPINDYGWVDTDILLPDDIFSNQRKTKQADIGDGILDVFDRYNFTVKEDEPLEKEVAIDPELLGKAYEKFNAIRPDNYGQFKKALKSGNKGAENKFNKEFGVYYTPREIVHYMCQESLTNYLATELDSMASKEDIQILMRHGEESAEHDKLYMEKKSNNAEYKGRYDEPKLSKSTEKYAKLIDDKLETIRVCDPAVGSGAFPVGMMHEIVRVRTALTPYLGKKVKRTPYSFKRHAIQHCLYGVDIDAGAVEIAKLRLWLSLVVDEEERGDIQPLPNLDYKIVQGNSLIGVAKNLFNQNLFNELEKLKPLYFDETNPSKKREFKAKIDNLIDQITDGHKDFDFEVYFSEVFHEEKGFDVVIANPPYVDIKGLPKLEVKNYFEIFATAENRINLYSIFIEKGFSILNESGKLCFINPNSILVNESYKKIRKLLVGGVDKIIKLPDSVFEAAVVETIILITSKISNNKILGLYFENDDEIDFNNLVFKYFNRSDWKSDPDSRFNIFVDQRTTKLLLKIENAAKPLGNFVHTSLGITPYDKYKGHSKGLIAKREFHSKTKLTAQYVPLITGKNIHHYYISDEIDEYLKYGDWLGAPRQKRFFESSKIIVRQILSGEDLRIVAGYSEKSHYFTQIGFSLLSRSGDNNQLKFILCLLNSPLMSYYHKNKFLDIEKIVFQKILIANCKLFPIKEIENYEPYVRLVDKILLITETENYQQNSSNVKQIQKYGSQINQMVYDLYGLTPEEIAVVEGGKGVI